jgi:16S rRNA (guanine966-N2)-methyltransferase
MPRHARRITVSGGEFRGRPLVYPARGPIRPSMQRTRLALFSALGERMDRVVFADLFCGGGAVGIDALSRGAARVHFVDCARDALDALRRNLEQLRVAPGRFVVHDRRVAATLEDDGGGMDDAHIVFADPPYDLDVNAELIMHFRASLFPALRFLVVEHRIHTKLETPVGMTRSRSREYGETVLTTFVPGEDA